MNFDEWFDGFMKIENLANMSIKDIAKASFDQGFVWCRMNTPMYVKTETGEITEVPREIEDSVVLPDDWVWDETEVDFESWLNEQEKLKNAKE